MILTFETIQKELSLEIRCHTDSMAYMNYLKNGMDIFDVYVISIIMYFFMTSGYFDDRVSSSKILEVQEKIRLSISRFQIGNFHKDSLGWVPEKLHY